MHQRFNRRLEQHAPARLLSLAALGVLALAAGPAAAETALDPEAGAGFREEFSANVPVSGNLLMGLSYAMSGSGLDPANLRVLLPGFSEPTRLCISASTRDGQYFAAGRVVAPQAATGAASIRQTWRYGPQLKSYEPLDYAVRVRAGETCPTDPSAPFLPVSLSGATTRPPGALVAAINSQRALKTSARLVVGVAVVTGGCVTSRVTRSTAFDTVCRFEPPKEGFVGEARLEVTRVLPTGSRKTDSFRVLNPPSNVAR